jgi:hypothetical protein
VESVHGSRCLRGREGAAYVRVQDGPGGLDPADTPFPPYRCLPADDVDGSA